MNIMLLIAAVFDKTEHIKVTDALLLALIGVVIVFIVLIVLMLIVTAVGKAFDGSEKLQREHPEWGEKLADVKAKMMFWKKKDSKNGEPSEDSRQNESGEAIASGTCGELKLINTDERDAAMIMAIVADSTGTPLNELRFKSIRKAEDNEQ